MEDPPYQHIVLDRILDPENLMAAWQITDSNGGGAGGDGMPRTVFCKGVDQRLNALAESVRDKSYRPGPPRFVDIPKANGGKRHLAIPCIADRMLQTATSRVLMPILDSEMSRSSYGYRPGRSHFMAVDRLSRLRRSGYLWVFKGDIERFFDSVDHRVLLEKLTERELDEDVLWLIETWLQAAPDGKGLPQGAPISPLLSNIYLDDFDHAVSCAGTCLVRFADDYLVACKSEKLAQSIGQSSDSLLAGLALRANPEKTCVTSFREGFSFLGHRFIRSHAFPEAKKATTSPDDDLSVDTAANDGLKCAEQDHPLATQSLRVLYLNRPDRRLSAKGNAFGVFEGDRMVASIPATELDRIDIGPSCQTSSWALRLGLRSGIPIAFVDGWGVTKGTCERLPPQKGALHLEQARCLLDPRRRLDLARRIVEGRIANQIALLHRLNRRKRLVPVYPAIRKLKEIRRSLPRARKVSTILGLEGAAAAAYWCAWACLLDAQWHFRHRRRRPPPDPVNVILSYLFGMLHRDIWALTVRYGLHPGFGALHGTRDRHQGCVSDLAEEFRAPLAEGLAVYLMNNRNLTPEFFFQQEDGSCRIASYGRARIIRGYERWAARTVKSPRRGCTISWRQLIEEQIWAYIRHVRGLEPYQSYKMDF